jgi:ArsR family transcriptional regulator
VASRRDGTSRYYAIALDGPDGARTRVWNLTREHLVGRAGVDQDSRRLREVLAHRSESSKQFFATEVNAWDRLREELFGRSFSMQALLGLLPSGWTVADLGCGTGVVVAALASHVARVIGVDASPEMLRAAADRVGALTNVDLERGQLEALPLADESVDAAVMMLVLHHLSLPQAAIADATRILKPGGRLLVVDMAAHEREELRRQMGHVWLGFGDDQIRRWFDQAGLVRVAIQPLPPATDAKGPTLFVATAEKPQGR